MSNRQGKCPGCGLTNFRHAAECQWCSLALRDRARNEYIDDAPAGPGRPWGLLLMLFAILVGGGGLVWHVQQKAAERADLAAEQAEAADDSAELPERTGPPALSGRSPSDPPREGDVISQWIEKNNRGRKHARQNPYHNYDFVQRPAAREQFGRDTPGREWQTEDEHDGFYRRPMSPTPEEHDDR